MLKIGKVATVHTPLPWVCVARLPGKSVPELREGIHSLRQILTLYDKCDMQWWVWYSEAHFEIVLRVLWWCIMPSEGDVYKILISYCVRKVRNQSGTDQGGLPYTNTLAHPYTHYWRSPTQLSIPYTHPLTHIPLTIANTLTHSHITNLTLKRNIEC